MDYIKARLAEPSTHSAVTALLGIAGAAFPQYSMVIWAVAGLFGITAMARVG